MSHLRPLGGLDVQPIPLRPDGPPRAFWFVVLAGAYLTLRGYHSFDGDQAYRLPLLLHQQDPPLFAADPFVRALDEFNPHRGYLAVLDAASRPLGLAAGLLGLFGLTLAATMAGVDRLARAVWPGRGGRVGLTAVALVLIAKAGNVGTNHLFESTLLDRLLAFALGWNAVAAAVVDPRRGVLVAAPLLGLAALVHPSVGLQLALTLAAAWVAWGLMPGRSGAGFRSACLSAALLGVALAPGLALVAGQGNRLLEGMPLDEFRPWAVEVQGPQHMLPSTWRLPQWLAFGCYPILAALALLPRDRAADPDDEPARRRFGVLFAVNLASLAAAYVAVEVVRDLRITLFQPFRMAMLARGLALVAVARRVVALWDRSDAIGRGRAVLIAVGLTGDWALVAATVVELAATLAERATGSRRVVAAVGLLTLGGGLAFLARHDTESGQVPILAALGILAVGAAIARVRPLTWNRRRRTYAVAAAWAIPALAAGVELARGDRAADSPFAAVLAGRCRFAEVPVDPEERLGRWCRDHTPPSSRFIGPPGLKEFRLWSRRALAFNRAGSPYHAAGLRDWSIRFRDHVGFAGSTADFARAYLAGRHRLEAGYDRMTPAEKLALARRQGATHVIERFDPKGPPPDLGPGLERLAVVGGYAIYRLVEDKPD